MEQVQYTQLTLGHLSRNKFWGEDPGAQYHTVEATSTLVQDGAVNILVDPALPVDEMERRLEQLCGMHRQDIDIVFATHFHTDHRIDAECYPNARLYMSPESVEEVKRLQAEGGPMADAFLNGAVFDFLPCARQLSEHVQVCPLPGHTQGLTGLLFSSGGRNILLSGDTIMNREYYAAREGYFIDASQAQTAASMDWASQNAQIIVPGHGDWFFADCPAPDLSWRRLNLCAAGQEPVVLVQTGGENILINPVLPGPQLRQALFDACGLDPRDITRVICLGQDEAHMRDVAVLCRAKVYRPAFYDAPLGPGRPALEPWQKTERLPLEIVRADEHPVCLFASGPRTVAVCCAPLGRPALAALGAQVALTGSQVQLLP